MDRAAQFDAIGSSAGTAPKNAARADAVMCGRPISIFNEARITFADLRRLFTIPDWHKGKTKTVLCGTCEFLFLSERYVIITLNKRLPCLAVKTMAWFLTILRSSIINWTVNPQRLTPFQNVTVCRWSCNYPIKHTPRPVTVTSRTGEIIK
jgi:hypothetical protein